jgi:hypothetical protein
MFFHIWRKYIAYTCAMKQKTDNYTSICVGDNWWVDIQPSHQCHKEPIHLVLDGGYGHMCLGYSEPVGHIGPFTLNY